MNHALIKLSIVGGVFIGGLLLYAFFVPSPSFAVEPTSGMICYTVAQLETDAKAKGRKIVGGASYDGAETDSSVVVQTNTEGIIYLTNPRA